MKQKEDLLRLPEVQTNFIGVGIPQLTAKLIKRTDKKAIYYRWDGVYEVFRIKIEKACVLFGNFLSRREHYPNNEDFGAIAWAYKDKDLAMERYDVL